MKSKSRFPVVRTFFVFALFALPSMVMAAPRVMERINRALVAIPTTKGVAVSWRMLGTDPDSVTFDLYRDGVKVNSSPITGATFYKDKKGKKNSSYELRAFIDGRLVSADTASPWAKDYLSIPLRKPAGGTTPDGVSYTYGANDASVGDLDGDGNYEIVLKWDPTNSKDNSQKGYTGEVFFDAYRMDGTLLWRVSMGKNIRAGAHYTQFMVYDFDSDGKAEIIMKTADGTTDGVGTVIGDSSADYRNEAGYVLSGPEYLTVFEGATGKALKTVDYDPPRGDVSAWGDGYGNRVDRFLACVAYLDGARPSVVMCRGYYTRTVLTAYDWRGGELTQRWRFDTDDEGYAKYVNMGNHNLSVGDVDYDGKDEIIYGAMAIDDDGLPMYTTGLGHGDAMHLGDLDPNRPGLEIFDVHEVKTATYGMEMHDSATGEILWGAFTGKDTGRGMSADIDPAYPGEECWAAGRLYSSTGKLIAETIPSSTNFGVWWDGDPLRELLDHVWLGTEVGSGVGKIDKWDPPTKTTTNILTADGTRSCNYTKGTPTLQADLCGDWREEVLWRSESNDELRLYSTTMATDIRLRTLMHDPLYRLCVAWQNVAYNQPPHPSFFLGDGMSAPPKPDITTP